MRFVRGQTGKRGRRPGQCGTQCEGEKGHAFAWSQLGDKKQNGGRAEGLGSVWEEKGHMRLCGLSWETRNKMGAGRKAWAGGAQRQGAEAPSGNRAEDQSSVDDHQEN
jgi:hypothetical protein